MNSSFTLILRTKWNEGKFVCVGLDSDYEKLPASVKTDSTEDSIFNFNKAIVDSTHDIVCAYKLQVSFYEAAGIDGWKALEKTVRYIRKIDSGIPVILDAKRADIGNTNKGYTKTYFDDMGFDAITVNPYLGRESLAPFLEYKDKGIIILVKTSNPGAGEFQDLKVEGKPLYQIVAEHVASDWNSNGNCAIVVGATYPEELRTAREIVGDMPILVPGIGAQGGDLESVIKNGLNSNKQGLIISSSRGIIFSENPREATEKLHNEIRGYLNAY